MDTTIDPPTDATADPALAAGTPAYAAPGRDVATARIPAPRDGEHDRIAARSEAPSGDGVTTTAIGDAAGADTRQLGLARVLTEPAFEDAITAFVATAPPLPEDVRSRLARLLRTNDCHDPADQETP